MLASPLRPIVLPASVIVGLLLFLLGGSSVYAFLPPRSAAASHATMTSSSSPPAQESQTEHANDQDNGINVAFLGNSILYFNDTPRFLVNLSKQKIAYQDSCLRGGTTLTELYTLGNGMKRHGFATNNALMANGDYDVGSPTVQHLLQEKQIQWDVIVMNEHTQGPARQATRNEFHSTLVQRYLPLITTNNPKATIIFIETAAYRLQGINNSEDLGTTHQFQQSVREGIQSYIQLVHEHEKNILARMAPVGTAFLRVHDDNHELWEKLFDPWDNFHPSPTGTFLQGCVLHCTIFGIPPKCPRTMEEIEVLWNDARMMHPKKKGSDAVALPSVSEVEYLWKIAWDVCQLEQSKL